MLRVILKNDFAIFLSFFAFALLLRLGTLFPTVIDLDESTYLVIAHQLINGDTLYVDTTDIKPFGIILFFTGLISIFQSILFIRLMAILLLAASAFALFRIKSIFTDNTYLKFMVGLTYIALMSAPFGFAFNTEILFTSCTIGGLYFFTLNKGKAFLLLSGLLFGLGFMTKYLVLFDILAIFIFFFVYNVFVKESKNFFQYIRDAFLVFVGFLIPFWGAHFYYYCIGHYSEFHFITYVLPFNYQGEKDIFADLDFVSGIHQRYIPFIIVFYLSLLNFWSTNKQHVWEKLFVFLWFVFAIYAIYLPGAHYRHYYLQAIPSISFLIPNLFFENAFVKQLFERKWVRTAGISALALVGIVYSGYWTNYYLEERDLSKEVYQYLKDKTSEDEKIWVVSPQIVHFMLDKKSPTRYVHPTVMVDGDKIIKFEIDVSYECDIIFKNNPPKYWVRSSFDACDPHGWNKNYSLEKKLSDDVLIFRRVTE